ncbi:hypothetical protein F5Y16DRAFT_394684 [Xylariaceae sp. FL0255]|nr:hypothetical protein F5Y16DRAFT_394684 [Xylariaceae sp. FL0255]
MPESQSLVGGATPWQHQPRYNFTIFRQHRSKLRQLYLEEDKSLKRVKAEMERWHGFPETKASAGITGCYFCEDAVAEYVSTPWLEHRPGTIDIYRHSQQEGLLL